MVMNDIHYFIYILFYYLYILFIVYILVKKKKKLRFQIHIQDKTNYLL